MKKLLLLSLIVMLNLFQHLTINAQCTAVTIATQPQNQNDSIPGHAHFTTTVAGTAPFNYYWYVNGTLTDSTINSASASNTYNTPALTMADSSNTYYCIITNCSGANSATSNTVHLLCIPVSITIQPLSQSFTAGNNDTISFSVTVNGTPPFTYKWYLNGSLIKTTTDTAGHRSIYSFYAHPVVYGMNGNTYHVTISNRCGGSGNLLASGNAVLTVVCPATVATAAWITGASSNGICGGANITLNTISVAGGIYNWTGSDGLSSSSQNPTDNINNNSPFCVLTFGYSVTVSVNGCVSFAGNTSIDVYEMPSSFGPQTSITICSGGAVNYGFYCGGYVNNSPPPCIIISSTNTNNNYFWNYWDTLTNTGATPCNITYFLAPNNTIQCSGGVVSFTVTVNPTPHVTVTSPTICAGDTATIIANGANTYTWSAGATPIGIDSATASPASTATYTVTGTNSYSCHSAAVSTVTVVNTLNTAVTQTADTLTSAQEGASYQWMQCLPMGGVAIAGATNQSYMPTANGQYSVIVTVGSCVDTSACVMFYTVGLNAINNNQSTINIYPNPFTEQTTITFSEEQKNTVVSITNVLGQCIQQLTTSNKQLTLDMSGIAKGIYFVKVQTENAIVNRSIVIQ